MKIFNFLSIVVLITAFTLSGCKKEAVVGPPGPAGANGTNGTNGKDGNANVVSGTVNVTTWTYSAPDAAYIANITSQSITQNVLNSGAVLVYLKYAENVWTQLPLTLYLDPTYSSTLEVVTTLNHIQIVWTDSDLTQPNTPPPLTFKVVVIASTGTLLASHVDTSNYLEVRNALNLKD
jgi:hypothetical protein